MRCRGEHEVWWIVQVWTADESPLWSPGLSLRLIDEGRSVGLLPTTKNCLYLKVLLMIQFQQSRTQLLRFSPFPISYPRNPGTNPWYNQTLRRFCDFYASFRHPGHLFHTFRGLFRLSITLIFCIRGQSTLIFTFDPNSCNSPFQTTSHSSSTGTLKSITAIWLHYSNILRAITTPMVILGDEFFRRSNPAKIPPYDPFSTNLTTITTVIYAQLTN